MTKKHKILFITIGDINVASTRVYVYQYLPFLESEGYQFEILRFGPHVLNKYKSGILRYLVALYIYMRLWTKILLLNLRILMPWRSFDTIFCQKVQLLPITARMLRNRGKNIVYCFDDAVYLRKSYLQIGIFNIKQFNYFLEKCSKIVVGTPYYLSQFPQLKDKILFIPNAVDTKRFLPRVSSEKVRIGWIGSPTTSKYLLSLLKVYAKLAEKYGNSIEFVFIGADVSKLQGVKNSVFLTWEKDKEYKMLQSIDIGVMPLENTEWEKGKCGYKLIQYFAAGIPALASPVGINSNLINESQAGFLCDDEASWMENLDILINNSKLRDEMGRNARNFAVKQHDIELVYNNLYRNIFN